MLECQDCGFKASQEQFPGHNEDNEPICPKCHSIAVLQALSSDSTSPNYDPLDLKDLG